MEERRRQHGVVPEVYELPVPSLGTARVNRVGDAPTRRFTARHAQLLADLMLGGSEDWSATALWACLEHLRVSTVTEAHRVSVIDAWTDGTDAFCIVYRAPFDDTRDVGLRRASHAAEPGPAVERTATYGETADMTAEAINWGYDIGSADAGSIDPVAFGWNVADFDVGEPLGFVATILRADARGVGWWGNLGDVLPEPPRDRPGDTR